MLKKRHAQKNTGFTLIETMIATALFVSVAIMSIGVLLNVSRSHKTTEIIRQGIDTMYFVMEDIARNIRLGSEVRCNYEYTSGSSIETPADCLNFTNSLAPGGRSLALEGQEGVADSSLGMTSGYTDQVAYVLNADANGIGQILKKGPEVAYVPLAPIYDPTVFRRMTPETVRIDLAKSGFTVSGAAPNSSSQTLVTIRLVGTISWQDVTVPFNIQTSISPRNIDS